MYCSYSLQLDIGGLEGRRVDHSAIVDFTCATMKLVSRIGNLPSGDVIVDISIGDFCRVRKEQLCCARAFSANSLAIVPAASFGPEFQLSEDPRRADHVSSCSRYAELLDSKSLHRLFKELKTRRFELSGAGSVLPSIIANVWMAGNL